MRASSPLAAAAMSAIELPAVASLARPPNFPALPRSDLSCGRMRFSSKLRTVASPLVRITSLRASSVRLATMCPPAIPKSSGTNLSWPCCSLRWLERLSSGQSPATTCSPRKRTSASPARRRSRLLGWEEKTRPDAACFASCRAWSGVLRVVSPPGATPTKPPKSL